MRLRAALTLFCILLLSMGASAQTIQNASYQTVGYIKSDGTIQDKSYRTVGYIKRDGTVQDASYRTIGYLKDNTGLSDMLKMTGRSRTGTTAPSATRRASHANGRRSISSSKSKFNTI